METTEIPQVSTKVVSPYRLGRVAGVAPQMVYNYIKKGFIKASTNELGKLQVRGEDANEWLTKYFTAKAEAAAKVTEELQAS